MWYDPPMTPRATLVLNGLLKKLNGLERRRKELYGFVWSL
ncbi:hypothetical protein V6N13_104253 [Hibiscus sabdariffa]